jgi:hypothetical protein
VAATTGLAQAGADTTTNALGVRTGTFSGMQIIQTHHLFSLYLHQIRDLVDHAAYCRGIFNFHSVANAAQTETAHRGPMLFQPAVDALNQLYLDLISHRNDSVICA